MKLIGKIISLFTLNSINATEEEIVIDLVPHGSIEEQAEVIRQYTEEVTKKEKN